MNKALRHDHNLPVNHLGFAWATDVAFVLSQPPYRLRLLSMADMMFAIARERPCRFQAASRNGTLGPTDVIVRCVQGHRGNVLYQMENESAHTRIWDPNLVPIHLHAAKTECLESKDLCWWSWVAPRPKTNARRTMEEARPRSLSRSVASGQRVASRNPEKEGNRLHSLP